MGREAANLHHQLRLAQKQCDAWRGSTLFEPYINSKVAYLANVTYGSDVVRKGCVIPYSAALAFRGTFPYHI